SHFGRSTWGVMETSTLSPVYASGRPPLPQRRLQHAQEVAQVQLVLMAQGQSKPVFIKLHHIHQSLGGAVMEERRPGGEASQYRSLDLADMVELAVDQRLPE